MSKERSVKAPPWGLDRRLLPSGAPGPCEQVQAGCGSRRPFPAASASQAPRRPRASRRGRWEPGQLPGPRPDCRPPGHGNRTAASPRSSTRRRPTGPPPASPSPCPCRQRLPGPRRCPRLPESPRLVDRTRRARLRRLFLRSELRLEEPIHQLFEAAPGPCFRRLHRPIASCQCCRRHSPLSFRGLVFTSVIHSSRGASMSASAAIAMNSDLCLLSQRTGRHVLLA